MLVIDLDDTLLHTNKTISLFTENVLNKACEAGIKIVFASARPIRTIKSYLMQVKCGAVIYHNGAITQINGQKACNGYGVPINEAVYILRTLQNKYPNKKLSIEINDKIYANFDVTLFWGKTSKDKEILSTSAIETDFSYLPDMDADKVIIEMDSDKDYEEILALLSPNLYCQLSDGGKLCLVMNKNATKLNAIKHLEKIWSISSSEIVAFGDDYNDLDMIKYCGVGIAMKNAIPEVIKAADHVTDTNDEDGVAKYIMKYIL